ncbi:MAG: peptide chain release factor N(5)-glutamine methyltransferase [Spirochaetota bacterium]|nr:peptide chain release factor N(5)-glutamine methyltransferase [Spirochaetota bacterium]
MITLRELNLCMVNILKECPFVENPLAETRLILKSLLNKTQTSFLAMSPETQIDLKIEQAAIDAVNARKSGRSMAAILGFRDFYDLRFEVDDNVLIPRPETEFLVEYVLNLDCAEKKMRVLDVGAGSGTICVTVAKHRPNWQIDALEVSDKAMNILKRNIELNNVCVNALNQDFFDFKPAHSYDLILSNPPYIPTQDVLNLLSRHDADDPTLALDGGDDGLIFYRELKKFAVEYLLPDGLLIMEHGFDQKKAMHDIFNDSPLYVLQTLKDYAGHDRISIVIKK